MGDHAILGLVVRMRREERVDDARPLLRGRRADRVDETAARADRARGDVENGPLARRQRCDVLGAAPPEDIGVAPDHAETGAGRVDQHGVVRPREGTFERPRGVVRRHRDPVADTEARHGLSHARKARGIEVERHDVSLRADEVGEVTGLAARRRAEVEDPGAVRGIDDPRHELRGLVLHGEGPLGEAGQGRHAAGRQGSRLDDQRLRRHAPAAGRDARVREAREQPTRLLPRPEDERRGRRVGQEPPARLDGSARRHLALDHPARVRGLDGEAIDLVHGERHVATLRRHPPQQRVREACRPGRDPLHVLHRLADRGVGRDAVELEELVGGEPESRTSFGMEGTERTSREMGEDVVEAPLPAQGAVDQLGQEGAVAGVAHGREGRLEEAIGEAAPLHPRQQSSGRPPHARGACGGRT